MKELFGKWVRWRPAEDAPARLLHGLLHVFTVNSVRAAEPRSQELTVKAWRSVKENMKELFGKWSVGEPATASSCTPPSWPPSRLHGELRPCCRAQITRAHREGVEEREGKHEGALRKMGPLATRRRRSCTPPSWPPSRLHGELRPCRRAQIIRAHREGVEGREGKHEGALRKMGPMAYPQEQAPARLLHGLLHVFTVNSARAAERRSQEPTVKAWRSVKENMKELFGKWVRWRPAEDAPARLLHGLLHAFTVNSARAAERRSQEPTVKAWRSVKENMKELLKNGSVGDPPKTLLHASFMASFTSSR